MLLGKRPRPPMKRTTSMTKFTLDLNLNVEPSSDPQNPFHNMGPNYRPNNDGTALHNQFLSTTVSPRNHRRYSADHLETSFLKACHLCKRRLIPGHDIFMYRGDSAFCSLECRQQQIVQDERKEKRSLTSGKPTSSTVTGSEVSATAETVAAV